MTTGSRDSITNQPSLFWEFRKQLQRPISESKVDNFSIMSSTELKSNFKFYGQILLIEQSHVLLIGDIYFPPFVNDVYVLKLFKPNRKLEKIHHYNTFKNDSPQTPGKWSSKDLYILNILTFLECNH